MKIRRLVSPTSVASAALAAIVLFAPQPAWSERTPPRALPLPEAVSARVIVKFKADGVTLRARALSATASALTVQQVMAERATLLGARHGLALAAGAAVGERVQVVTAQGIDARTLAARLAADPDVEYAEPAQRMRRTAAPNDSLYAASVAISPAVGQWYLRAPSATATSAINAEAAWDLTQGNPSVIVAVLDTGARFDHPDLAAKLVPGYDFISDTKISGDGDGRDADAADPGDFLTRAEIDADAAANPTNPTFAGCTPELSSWHGTQTAGLVGASTNNVIGMASSGRNVRVMPVRVLGKCFGDSPDIQAAIRWAAGVAVPGVPANPNPAKVINLSLGSDNPCSAGYIDAVNQARARGAVVVAAAGNSSGHAVGQPANCPGVIGVAAIRHAGSKVGFSDIGPQISIAAPGGNCVNILENEPCLYPLLTTVSSNNTNALPNTGLTYTDGSNISAGTSFASPLVAGTVGLMFSANPALTPDEVATRLKASARPFPASGLPPDPETGPVQTCHAPSETAQLQCYCTTSTCGAGMLNAAGAVVSALGVPVVTVTGTPSAPLAGETVALSGAGSVAPAGRSIVSQQWTLVDGGGIVTGFIGATNGLSSSVTPSAAGSFTVRLTVTDSLGAVAASELTVTVAAVPSGGGAFAWPWLALLAAFVGALARRQRAAMG